MLATKEKCINHQGSDTGPSVTHTEVEGEAPKNKEISKQGQDKNTNCSIEQIKDHKTCRRFGNITNL